MIAEHPHWPCRGLGAVSVIIWHLNYHRKRADPLVARIGLQRSRSVKTAEQIPLAETPRQPKNVLFAADSRLCRKSQGRMENGFLMSPSVQSGALYCKYEATCQRGVRILCFYIYLCLEIAIFKKD